MGSFSPGLWTIDDALAFGMSLDRGPALDSEG